MAFASRFHCAAHLCCCGCCCCCLDMTFFCSLSALRAFFVSHRTARQKRSAGRQGRTHRARVGGRSGGRAKCQTRTSVWRAAALARTDSTKPVQRSLMRWAADLSGCGSGLHSAWKILQSHGNIFRGDGLRDWLTFMRYVAQTLTLRFRWIIDQFHCWNHSLMRSEQLHFWTYRERRF